MWSRCEAIAAARSGLMCGGSLSSITLGATRVLERDVRATLISTLLRAWSRDFAR
jgi:hypothetical protein